MIPSFIYAFPLASFVPLWALVPLVAIVLFLIWFFQWPARKVEIHPIRASSFKPELVPKFIDSIVIGSGSGGCACANLLAQSGQKVLLLEQHYRTGGCTHTFREQVSIYKTRIVYLLDIF
jgi:all-trans-retinol 13,14-reductase